MTSLGIKLNNPFDLEKSKSVWKGEIRPGSDARFCQFESMPMGIRAGIIDIVNMNVLDGLKTLEAMAEHYAPPGDNNTEEYINILCDSTGYEKDCVLDLTDEDEVRAVAMAFLHAEQGSDIHLIAQNILDAGFSLAFSALRLDVKNI